MEKKTDPVYSRNVLEFVAAANEFCKYAERSAEIKGGELLRILQRLLPYLYIRASFLPSLEPVFEDGNEKFVTESDWNTIHDSLKKQFGSTDEYLDIYDAGPEGPDNIVQSSLSENLADMYQDIKDFLLLYQTGTEEIMNDAVWECKISYENIWGQKLVNSLRAIHMFIYSGDEPEKDIKNENDGERDTSEWFISKRQREYGKNDE
ncbi:MAG TPA: DUF5063 domain-containing protein [Bacteroidales bacterium]|jgi:hypothetical protein|nr:DUF5063 domain-containing protein [Bacteroidales bacterium]HOS71697.1 DUF5063 domain-containing protein [Bacteroidales bacterium]HQH25279.1 DUF5063 domain-containing protein [Bacteroidales bacterium]HQJ83495.1 DUF5063 domain-containing protein [Bacteroidales bacterium]